MKLTACNLILKNKRTGKKKFCFRIVEYESYLLVMINHIDEIVLILVHP